MPSGVDIYRKSLLAEQSRGASNYHYSVRTAVRGLWTGALLYMQFIDSMMSTIRTGLTRAYAEGAAACGVVPAEYTFEEKIALEQTIVREQNYIGQFADAIEKSNKASGGKLKPLMARAGMWVNRYKDVQERAQSLACADMKAQWVYGDTIEHCRDCSRVVGRIYRLSTWDRYGWIPASHDLACGGWRCGCRRISTEERATPGRPPKLLGP